MRKIAIIAIVASLGFAPLSAYAYPEYPPFEQTAFRDEYGMFRWWRGCWFRVLHAYAYIICSPNGEPVDRVPLSEIPGLIELGILPADSASGLTAQQILAGQRGRTRTDGRFRYTARTLTPAEGEGIRLSDLYRNNFQDGLDALRDKLARLTGLSGRELDDLLDRLRNRFGNIDPDIDLNGLRNLLRDVGFDFGGFDPSAVLRTGIADRDGFGNGFSFGGRGDNDGSGFRFGGDGDGSGFQLGEREERDRSNIGLIEYLRQNGTAPAITDPREGGGGFTPSGRGIGQGTRMHDIFYRPLIGGCSDIHDGREGEIFGEAPCTSYPDVFGPVPSYGGTN